PGGPPPAGARRPRGHHVRHVAVALAVTLTSLGAACGRKSLPVAPETVRPRAPATLAAASTSEGIRLTWLRPLLYTGGQRMHDLDRVLVERAPGEGAPSAFAGVRHLVWFADKANDHLAILRLLAREGAGFDVVSEGELWKALRAGADGRKIVFSGVGKTEAELEAALDANLLMINVESP